jgi:methylated-DNA-[protein]-cysteine S-methyltransferase
MLTVASDGENVSGLWIEGQKYFARTLEQNPIEKSFKEKDSAERDLPLFENVRTWLDCYFSGREPDFMPPLMPKGSPFQKSIWNILCKIPYGQTTTYGEIANPYEAQNNGKRTSPRAVGGAVGHNPISIIIPCHRVVGAGGSLTGYAGGIDKKIQLLQLEGVLKTGH